MDSIKIAVVGRTLNDKRWNVVYELLEEGVQEEVLESYTKYNVDASKVIPDSDAYIYIATIPKVKDKPMIHLQASASEDDIEDAMQELIKKLIDIPKETFVDDTVQNNKISGLIIEVNGKDISLNKEDFLELKEMLRLCEIYKFQIKEVICDGN